jgi:N-acyl-D-amino-acid deacylase
MSTGLDYPPGSYADTAELTELSREAARLGGIYHTHVRYSLGDRFLDPFREALDIGRGSDIPVHITHFYHRTTSPGSAGRMLGLVEDARDAGLDVTFDSYPYNLSSTRLTILLPQWTHDGGYARLMEVLRDQKLRTRLRSEMGPRASSWGDMWLTNFRKPANHRFEGRSILQVADLLDKDPIDVVCDLLVEEDLETCYVSAGGNLATLPKFVSHPLSMVGSDAVLIGDYPSPRTYGCFPVILAEFVREERFLRTARRHPEDDVLPGPASRATRPWPAAGRLQGRRGRVRRQDGQSAGDADAAEAVPDRDRLRDRQRPGRRGQRQAYGDAGRPGAAKGPGLDVDA